MQGIVPSTGATAANQSEEISLIETLNSLIETNNYLVQFLTQLTGAMNSGQPALRTIPIASVSTVVSSVTNFGTGVPAKEMADDMNNLVVTMSNINNVTA